MRGPPDADWDPKPSVTDLGRMFIAVAGMGASHSRPATGPRPLAGPRLPRRGRDVAAPPAGSAPALAHHEGGRLQILPRPPRRRSAARQLGRRWLGWLAPPGAHHARAHR